MKDLTQCSVIRNDFQRWLNLGTAPLTIERGEKDIAILTRLEKSPSVDYLYKAAIDQNGGISWDNGLTFFGMYDRQDQTLYLTEDSLSCLTEGQYPFTEKSIPSMVEEISSRINRCVEERIANDRNNLPVQGLTSSQALRDLQYCQNYGAKENIIQLFFNGSEPDIQFHSDYTLERLPEAAFMTYLQDPEGFVQTEADQYIKSHQEKFLLEFLKNDILLMEYQALMQDTSNPIHRMKAITEAVQTSGAKTVTVTVQKGEQELSFKATADSLTGYRNYYSTADIPAQDRREFKHLFGQHADYTAEDITKITYGKNTIYEAPSEQAEDMTEKIGMGGMSFV